MAETIIGLQNYFISLWKENPHKALLAMSIFYNYYSNYFIRLTFSSIVDLLKHNTYSQLLLTCTLSVVYFVRFTSVSFMVLFTRM